MRFVCVLVVLVLAGCGSESDPDAPADLAERCANEGAACIQYGYGASEPRDGTCRAYKDATDAFVCCAGCWDSELRYCQPGDSGGKCGTLGEDCSAAKCK